MLAYGGFDPFFTLIAGFAILGLGALIVNRRASLARSHTSAMNAGHDRSGQLLTLLSVITGVLILGLAAADALI